MNTNFTPFPELVTERLTLRRLDVNDAREIMLLRSDKDVNKFVDRAASITIEEAKKFIRMINKGIDKNEWIYWAISLKSERMLIGTICFWNMAVEKAMAEIGYELHPAHQGKGIMQEAMSKVTSFGFEKINLKVITAFPKAENHKSIQVLVKNKFLLDNNHTFSSKEEAHLPVYYLKF